MQTPKPIVTVNDVTKLFGGAVPAVDNVSLKVNEGEFFALLGPSGCGKTTLLRMIAGFEVPTSGDIHIDGQEMSGIPPNRRPVNMVFQSYAVFPHMTVFDNVGYGLRVTATPKAEIANRVEEALDLVQMGSFARRKPDQLSGGQRQRVALARALVKKPRVLLLDEPLSALDAKLREAMQLELVRLQHSIGITFIIVTHDQDEALSMADRIAVMEGGSVQQVAPPVELYEYPSTRFVADFIGKMNVFEAKPRGYNDARLTVDVGGLGTIEIPHGEPISDNFTVAIRPEKMHLGNEGTGAHDLLSFPATVQGVAYHGSESHVYVKTNAGAELSATIQNRSRERAGLQPGDSTFIGWKPNDTLVLTR